MKTIDMHIHTTASDGSFTPKELIDYAVEKNLSAIAITDHDTMRGIQEAMKYIEDSNISLEIIPGIEVSTYGAHILGYFVDKSKEEITNIINNLENELQYTNRSSNEAIKVIQKFGGISSIAHPKECFLPMSKFKELVKDLASTGLNGIECYYTTHSKADIAEFKRIAAQNGLTYTGGTDFHGTNKPGVDLGSGFGNLEIPYEIIDNIKNIVN